MRTLQRQLDERCMHSAQLAQRQHEAEDAAPSSSLQGYASDPEGQPRPDCGPDSERMRNIVVSRRCAVELNGLYPINPGVLTSR
jgi:hypothetical protein